MLEKIKEKKYYFIVGAIIILIAIILLVVSCSQGYKVELKVGNSTYYQGKLHKGDTLEKIEVPTKEGYTFDGWYANNEKIAIDTPIEEDIILEARFTKNTYIVTINYDNGSDSLEKEVEYEDTLEELKTPKKSGYTFLGWYVGEEKFDFSTKIESNISITAKWEKNATKTKRSTTTEEKAKYTVKHYLMGLDGKYTIAFNTETFKDTVGEYVNPDVKTYEGFTSPKTKKEKVLENDKLVIKYYYQRNRYMVTFNSMGGSTISNKSVYFEKGINKPTNPTRRGYDFAGWYQEESLVNAWNFESNIMPSHDITLYAKWNIHKYDVTFDANGGVFVTGEKSYTVKDQIINTKITAPSENPTKEGYTFAGWYKDKEGTEAWDFDVDISPDKTLTLYAKWTPITYKVAFDGNASTTGEMETIRCTYDEACTIPENVFEREYVVTYNYGYDEKENKTQNVKYTFAGWSYSEDDILRDAQEVMNLTSEENGIVTLKAKWIIDEETSVLENPTREGYTFTGWYSDEDTKVDTLSTLSLNITLTAHWTAIEYTIVFNGNGGKNVDGKESVEVTAKYGEGTNALDTFTKTSTLTYDFANGTDSKTTEAKTSEFKDWKLDDTTIYNSNAELKNLTTESGERIVLTAEWTDPEVTIDEENPTKENNTEDDYYTYEFKNWSEGETAYKKDDKIILTKDITLTAQYLKVIDTDKYITEKITTAGRTDISTTKNENHKYTIDIKEVNDSIVDDRDVEKIETILKNEDVLDVKLVSSNTTSIIITKENDAESKIDEFLADVTKTTSDKVETEKHLSSLFKRSISVIVDFDPELAKTTENKTSVQYDLTYTNDNQHIITQEMLYGYADSGITPINNSDKKHYKVKRKNNVIKTTYQETEAEISIACIFSKKGCAYGSDKDKAYMLQNKSGGTGMNNSITEYFKNSQINSITILNENFQEIEDVDATNKNMSDEQLVSFAANILYALDVLKSKPSGNFYLDAYSLVAIIGKQLEGKTFNIRVNLKKDYAFEDDVDNVFNIEILSPNNYALTE